MAYASFHILCLIFVFPCLVVAQGNGTVPVSSFLAATDEATPWRSASGDFAFGFQQVQHMDHFVLFIWYGNEGNTVPRGSKVELTADRGLILTDSQGKELWNSTGSIPSEVYHGFMNETGNFVLVHENSFELWASFSNPTDTLLPTQIMQAGGVLYSQLSETNFSRASFQLRLLIDGNLVLNTRDIIGNYAPDAYYLSNTFGGTNSSNTGYRVIFSETGYMYVLRRSGERTYLSTESPPSSGYYEEVVKKLISVQKKMYDKLGISCYFIFLK